MQRKINMLTNHPTTVAWPKFRKQQKHTTFPYWPDFVCGSLLALLENSWSVWYWCCCHSYWCHSASVLIPFKNGRKREVQKQSTNKGTHRHTQVALYNCDILWWQWHTGIPKSVKPIWNVNHPRHCLTCPPQHPHISGINHPMGERNFMQRGRCTVSALSANGGKHEGLRGRDSSKNTKYLPKENEHHTLKPWSLEALRTNLMWRYWKFYLAFSSFIAQGCSY